MEFTKGRQLPFFDDESFKNEAEVLFTLLADKFDLKWLEANTPKNIIQKVWQRRDFLASNELLTLAIGIQKLLIKSPKWLTDQIKKAKSDNENSSRGALFEILGLSFFEDTSVELLPTYNEQPGYDAILKAKSGYSVKLSLKNYFISSHEKEFRKQSKAVETELQKIAIKSKLTQIGFFAESSNHPNGPEWNSLISRLNTMIPQFENNLLTYTGKDWFIALSQLPQDDFDFSSEHLSYTSIVISPFHKNEIKNLFDKLDSACSNLIQHSPETDFSKNIVFVHLSRTASFEACRAWSAEYLKTNPNAPISGILLYQTCVFEIDEGTLIGHYMHVESRPEYNSWIQNHPELIFNLKVPIGKILNQPTIPSIQSNNHKKLIPYHYVFQSGNLFKLSKIDGDSSYGEMNKLASGIFTHSLATLGPPGHQKTIKISGRYPEYDELEFL